jgi:hypothetical protein
MKHAMRFSSVALAAALLAMAPAHAQDKPYTEGHVWTLTIVKVKYGLRDIYLNDVLPLRKKIEEEARKEGLLLSSHILVGDSTNRDDFDVMFLQEHKSWGTFDGFNAKMDAIEEKLIGPPEKQNQIVVKRLEVREVVGQKMMQELLLK